MSLALRARNGLGISAIMIVAGCALTDTSVTSSEYTIALDNALDDLVRRVAEWLDGDPELDFDDSNLG